ncbi:MAG TPA: PQQ-binding-like beta-propeller repeat protein [Gemmataceae bacterium]|jgi:outer membrane protein assembly factor BamB|nr:PQQ-binding-like beta-propeller repeat protein [Gemmataceae bacterium]
MFQRWTRLVASVLVSAACAAAQAGDWPQWRGPHRDGLSPETGLLKRWPKEGPPLVWKATKLGEGYSSVSVAGGRIFTMGERKAANGSSKEQYVTALDERTGKELWTARVGAPWGDGGPRSTPTVDGDLLYALGPHGDLVCLATATGKARWRKNLSRDFAGQKGGWGHCESPLVDGTRLVCTPGGKDATLVALNKKTGATIWKAHVPEGDAAAYSSVIVANVRGQREYIQFLGHGLVGVAAKDGTFLWRYDKPANGTANCSTPVYHDAGVFAASAYGTGGGLAKLSRDGDTVQAREAYFTKHMQNHHGGMVLVDGYLYGSDEGQLCCLEFKTGKVMWENHHAGKGSIVCADGRLYYRNEGGPLVLVEANPHKYVEHGRFNQPSRSGAQAWPHPAIANGKLYIRDSDILLCFDVKQH